MIREVVKKFCCFFFKQKRAYEMRISDWSSDVCSSDLSRNRLRSWASIMPNWSSGLWRRHYERGDDQARRRGQAQAEKWRPDSEAPLTHRSFAGCAARQRRNAAQVFHMDDHAAAGRCNGRFRMVHGPDRKSVVEGKRGSVRVS